MELPSNIPISDFIPFSTLTRGRRKFKINYIDLIHAHKATTLCLLYRLDLIALLDRGDVCFYKIKKDCLFHHYRASISMSNYQARLKVF
mgnify:CR=1 FL=1